MEPRKRTRAWPLRTRRQLRSVVVLALLAASGCCSSGMSKGWYDRVVYDMYRSEQEELGPPPVRHIAWVRELGRERFISLVTQSRPAPDMVYALGWFGDLWHVDLVAEHLDDEDPEMQRVALRAFSRLTGQHFSDAAEAIKWWDQNRERFPLWAQKST